MSQQTFLVFQDVLKTSWRRIQRNTFRLPRRLADVFKTYLQCAFLKRLQDVLQDLFKTFPRRLQDVFARRLAIMPSRRLQDVFQTSWNTKKMLQWRHLQDVFKTSSVRLHQDECLLGYFLMSSKGLATKL